MISMCSPYVSLSVHAFQRGVGGKVKDYLVFEHFHW